MLDFSEVMSQSRVGIKVYIKIKDVPGWSHNQNMSDYVDVIAWRHDLAYEWNPQTAGGAVERDFGSCTLILETGKHTPKCWELCSKITQIDEIEIVAHREYHGEVGEYYKVAFEGCRITDMRTVTTPGKEGIPALVDVLGFQFTKIKWTMDPESQETEFDRTQ